MQKMWIKRVGTILATVCFLNVFCSVSAQQQYVVNEFFRQEEGSYPFGWVLKEIDGTVSVKTAIGATAETNTLNLRDLDAESASGVAALMKFPAQKQKTVFETNLKCESQSGEVSFVVGGGTGEAVRVTIGWDGNFIVYTGSGARQFTKSKASLGSWNVIRIMIDPIQGKTDVRVNSELFSDLAICNDCSETGLDYFMLMTGYGAPDVYVDYVTVECGSNVNAEVQPIIPDMIEDPEARPVPDRVNVRYNGKYLYFDYPPIMSHDRVMLPLRKIFEIFSMKVEWDQETETALIHDDEHQIKIREGATTAQVNGTEIPLYTPAIVLQGRMYVPVRFIAESIGAFVDWDSEFQTVIINR